MGFAEQKKELLRIVENADEALTSKLIAVAKLAENDVSKFSEEELLKFHASREQYRQNPDTALTLDETHSYIRSLKNK